MPDDYLTTDAGPVVVPPSGVIPAGAPGAGRATVGTESMPFPRQVWTQANWDRYRQERDVYDAAVRARQEEEAAYQMEQRMLADAREQELRLVEVGAQNARVNRAQQALDAARQFTAQRMYQSEMGRLLSSGVPLDQAATQAFLKWGLGNRGGAAAVGSVLRSMQSGEGPLPPMSAADVPGLPGYKAVQLGPQSRQLVAPPRPVSTEVTPRQRADILKAKMGALTDAMLSARGAERDALRQQMDATLREYESLGAPASLPQAGARVQPPSPAPSGERIRVRRKSDGRTFNYPGSRADAENDPRYEIVNQ